MTVEHLVKLPEVLGKSNTTSSQDLLVDSTTQAKEIKKQTAVEWLIEQIIINELIDVNNGHQFIHLQSIAKQMEKEYMILFYLKGCNDTYDFDESVGGYDRKDAEEYYNETFKNS